MSAKPVIKYYLINQENLAEERKRDDENLKIKSSIDRTGGCWSFYDNSMCKRDGG